MLTVYLYQKNNFLTDSVEPIGKKNMSKSIV